MTYLASICDNCSKPLGDPEDEEDPTAQTCEGCGGTFCAACIGDIDHNCEADP